MSTYVCSDIHGHFKAFFDLLEKINFSKNDILYILGDVMEYESESLKIIEFIRENNNIILLKGNQEDIFINEIDKIIELDYFVDNDDESGLNNIIDVLARKGKDYVVNLKEYLTNLPFIKILDKFILVHGNLELPQNYESLPLEQIIKVQDEHNCIYGREFVNTNKKIEGYTVVLGHTITLTFDRKQEGILYREGKILIDCGAAINKRLAALRLDDMEEFYIEV